MAILADRVLETTTSQGTGTINLAGATDGFQTFVAGASDGAEVTYTIEDGSDWETGIGTVTAGSPDTLSRDTITDSSNAGAAVDWGAGTRNVFITTIANQTLIKSGDNVLTGNNTFEKFIFIKDAGELTISSGSITPLGSNITVDTEGDAASDDLETITGAAGAALILRQANTSRVITVKHGTGNINTYDGLDIVLDSTDKFLFLIYDAENTVWNVIARPTDKLIEQNSKSADYTLQLSDVGKHIYHPTADTTARTWTIPANASVAFPIGSAITFINDTGAGELTIAITTDTLVFAGDGSTGSRTLPADGNATAIKITETKWQISGVGLE